MRVRSGQGDYTVEFEDALAPVLAKAAAVRGAVAVVDRNVARLYAEDLAPLFAAMPHLLLDATEEEKSLIGVGKLAGWLQERGCNRQSVLVAIGGGIVQDIATVTAHLYYRGLSWIFIPTTLLSMSDSCIGAKGGVNHGSFKNQLGAFHSPARVLVTTRFVDTLSSADVASGYGEILKLMATGSAARLEDLGRVVAAHGLRNLELARLIRESLEVKRQVIEADEYEKGLRRILNFGHTFGHALEAVTRYAVPHGLAVAWGMDLMNHLAVRRGILDERHALAMRDFTTRFLYAPQPRPLTARALIDAARRDKKVAYGQVALVMLEHPGALRVVSTAFDGKLEQELADYLERHDVFAPR